MLVCPEGKKKEKNWSGIVLWVTVFLSRGKKRGKKRRKRGKKDKFVGDRN